MNYKEITKFLKVLTEKTKEKKIVWNEGDYQQGYFEYKFNDGIVIIHRNKSLQGQNVLTLRILNKENRLIVNMNNSPIRLGQMLQELQGGLSDSEFIKGKEEIFECLSNLYEIVYKQYYNVEETIQGMLSELENQ